jgi:hypothetical protein
MFFPDDWCKNPYKRKQKNRGKLLIIPQSKDNYYKYFSVISFFQYFTFDSNFDMLERTVSVKHLNRTVPKS